MNHFQEREDRLKKLRQLQEEGINPYPSRAKRTHLVSDFLINFSSLKKSGKIVFIAGRLRSIRRHGNISFANIEDRSGSLQLVFSKKDIGKESYRIFKQYIDVGDFIEVQGEAFLTVKKEKSLFVKKFKLLTKTLLPLPDKWGGLRDKEEKLRKRYLDILVNPEVKEMIVKKSIFWNSVREFLQSKNFLEVETPVLETTPGGADARPFVTHHNALDIDLYLRISMGELWQKKLMVAGMEKTFEIGRQFRNEGMDAEHLQDYTQIEFYWAYADYMEGMKLVTDLYRYIARKTFQTLKFNIKNFTVDLGKKWEIYDYRLTIKKETGLDISKINLVQAENKLKELKVDYEKKGLNLGRAVDILWKYCRKKINGPGFLINEPVLVSPLAKRKEDDPSLTERFHVIIAGSELGNGYSELNNPIDQKERFLEQQKLREEGDEEAQRYDKDFIEALEYGMPPTFGFGLSERLFSFLYNKTIRECQIFPLLKPKNK